MDTIKKYGILAGKFILAFLIGTLLLSILNFFFLSSKITHIIGFIYLLILFFIFSMTFSKTSSSRGIITGLKTGCFFIAILLIMNLLACQSPFHFLRLLYYLILCLASILGAIVGVNTKKNEES